MKQFLLFSSMLLSFTLFAQVGSGVSGTLNQVDKDPAVKDVQNDYDELQQEVEELEEPERQEEEELPFDDEVQKMEEDPTPNFIEENEI